MTRTTQALKRLGVAAIAIATIGAGAPALIATGANAANTTNTGVTITPTIETNIVNDCNPFTVNVTPADTTTVDIQISQTVATGTATIGFCSPGTDQGSGSQAGPNGPTTTTDIAGFVRPTTGNASQCAQPASGTTVTCDAEYTTNAAGALTFGVISNSTGTLNVTAFVESNNPAATPGFGTYNTTGNNVPGGSGENQATATKNLVTNANNAVTSLECTPASGGQNIGTTATFTCTAYSTVGTNTKVPTRGVTVSNIINSGPDKSTNLTQNDPNIVCGQPTTATPPTVNNGTTTQNRTNNQGTVFCSFANNGQPGTDNVVNYVEQNGTAGPQSTEPNTSLQRTFAGAARYINCTPKNPTVRYGIDQTITCTVTDLNGNPVNGVLVDFQASFPGGRFTDNAFNSTQKTTNASGVVTVTINNPDQTSTQSQTVTASIAGAYNPNTQQYDLSTAECNQAAGKTTQPNQTTTATTPSAGKCQDVVTISYTTASASPTASSSTTPPTGTRPTLSTSTPDIQPNIQGVYNATGLSANTTYELRCYTRPSTTYFTARSATTGSNTTLEFRILPGANTRCYVRPAGNEGLASNSVVINVHTTLSLSAVGNGQPHTYIFQGRNLPRRAGQLITLYRIANGQEIRTSNLTTDSSGIYRVTRTFTGKGTFQFRVRTSQTLNNAAGASNIITVTIR